MLRNFLYLNETMLGSYLGAVEGGLSSETIKRRGRRGTRGGEAGVEAKVVSGKFAGQRELSEEDESVVRDTPEHRFERLMSALEADPDTYSYEEVLDLADAFDRLSTGTFITVDCEVEVPPTVAVLAQPEKLNEFLDLAEMLGPLASAFGESTEGLPNVEEIKAARGLTQLKADLVVVGEIDDESPRLAGKLVQEFVREMPEGEARVVGKVAKRWNAGERHPLLALPGASLMTRSERRKATPEAGMDDDANVLQGPALTLDMLAIYR